MTRTVHKFPLEGGRTECLVTKGSKFVHFGLQGSELYVWIEVDQNQTEKATLVFSIIGTGWPIPPDLVHRGSVILGVQFVWHLYEHPQLAP